jgi:eukaryotic-like serine/threonine-protein kinase
MKTINAVTDLNGVRYDLTESIGHGGQGTVYAVKGGRLAVKILASGSQARRDRLRNQLMHVRRLPLRDLSLAKPLEMLRPPHTGYVMELLNDMATIKSLMSPNKGQAPSVEWYLGVGGLRRRLFLLGRAAHVLSKLHGKGLVYSDPSPTNIFVSKNLKYHEVWFIDTDNLKYESTPSGNVFTPGYAAPELVSGASGVTTLTDAFAFSVIAFQVLTLAHPFIGDMVNEGEPELEEQAFSGLLPWIDDSQDTRNSATFGVPRTWVLSPRLIETFSQAFGAGRNEPSTRPGVSEWADRLFRAADATIRCSDCSEMFFFNQSTCPWCNRNRPDFVMAVFYLWDPSLEPRGGILTKPKGEGIRPVIVDQIAISENQTFVITRRHAFGNSKEPIVEPVVSVTWTSDRIKIRSLDGNVYLLIAPTRSEKTEIGDYEKTTKINEREISWRLHFGGSDTLHRVMSFELRRGRGL